MQPVTALPSLAGQKALVIGIANAQSIAYGCAKALREAGAELVLTYLNEKALPHVAPLAEELGASLLLPLDVRQPEQLENVFARIEQSWGSLDIAVHSIAWAPLADLQGKLLDSSAAGFAEAMDVSCHSFIRMARLAVPLMQDGGSLFTMSYHGANKVVPNYNLMGPVKAALEASCRYLAHELGPQGIRVHALSPGPIRTRAASGLKDFDSLLAEVESRSLLGHGVDIMDVGYSCAWLASRYARHLSGATLYIDAGSHLLG